MISWDILIVIIPIPYDILIVVIRLMCNTLQQLYILDDIDELRWTYFPFKSTLKSNELAAWCHRESAACPWCSSGAQDASSRHDAAVFRLQPCPAACVHLCVAAGALGDCLASLAPPLRHRWSSHLRRPSSHTMLAAICFHYWKNKHIYLAYTVSCPLPILTYGCGRHLQQSFSFQSLPNSSPSSMVCGRRWCSVSGKRNPVMPPSIETNPIMTNGNLRFSLPK